MKAKLTLAISLIVFVLALFALSKLQIVSNMEEMLPGDSKSLKASNEFNKYFDGQDQAIIIVKAKDSLQAGADFKNTAESFLSRLNAEIENSEYVDSVLYKLDLGEITPYAWAYIETDVYDKMDAAIESGDMQAVQAILEDVSARMENEAGSEEYLINDAGTHYMMLLKPAIDSADFLGSRDGFYNAAWDAIDKLLSEPEYSSLDAGLTGGAFIQDIEADGVAFDGLFGTMAVTLAMILLVLILFFRSLKLPLLSLYPLLLGAVCAAAFAYIAYGSINMFAVSFALLLMGLGIDFAVHLLTRYQEERGNGLDTEQAAKISAKSTGGSIIFGALTTALSFAAFAFAKFKAFEQMGVISAVGLLLLCAGMLTLVPAIILAFDRNKKTAHKKQLNMAWLRITSEFFMKRPWIVFALMAAALLGLGTQVTGTKMQSDITAIYPDNIPSLYWAQEVKNAFDYNTDTESIYADDAVKLQEYIDALEKRSDIEKIDSIFEHMPEEQERKLATMKKLNAILEQMGINDLGDFTLDIMTVNDLPEAIKQNYMGNEGRLRAEIVPAIDMYNRQEYETLAQAIYKETGSYPVGMPAIFNEITQTVTEDILKISIACFAIVFITALGIFRKIKLAALTVTPLVMTLYTALGLLPLLNIEINIFSIAAFPLIIGIGIDSSIHLIHRLKEESPLSIAEKTMHTGKAILLTGITTIIGFGSLAAINHPGMANLGLSVAVGIAVSMAYTLIIIPALYGMMKGK